MKPASLLLRASVPVLAVLLFAGCETGPDRRAMREEARHSVPPMAASDTFFGGQVGVKLTLGGLDVSPDERGGGRGGGSSRHGGGHHGGGPSLTGGSNRGGMGGEEPSFGSYEGNDRLGPTDVGSISEVPVHHGESEMPPAMLRLRLENTGPDPVVVEVRDLDSVLGNFAVRPDRLVLEPGKSAEPDPMESLLGLDTYTVPVTLTLRVGGKTETKILTLRPVTPAPAPAPVAPPATP